LWNATAWVPMPSGGSGGGAGLTIGGVDTNVQFNESNSLGGDSEFAWNTTSKTLTIDGAISSQAISGGTILNHMPSSQIRPWLDAKYKGTGATFSATLAGDLAGNLSGASFVYGLKDMDFVSSQAISGGTYNITTPYTHIVYTDGTNYFARNGDTQKLSSNSNAATLINNIIAASSNIFFREGTYTLDGSIVKAVNKVTLEGSGKGTIFYVEDDADCSLISVGGNDWTIRNMKLDGNRSTQRGQAGVSGNKYNNLTFENIHFYNISGRALYMGGGNEHVRIQSCDFEDCSYWGILVYNSGYDYLINNCSFQNVGVESNLSAINISAEDGGNTHGVSISNCYFENNGYLDIELRGVESTLGELYDVSITNCTSSGSSGFRVQVGYNISIVGNTIIGSSKAGMLINGGHNISINGNTITNTAAEGIGLARDVYCNYEPSGITIEGNSLYNIGDSSGDDYGISVLAGENINIVGNMIWDDRATQYTDIGVYSQSTNRLIVSNNIIDNIAGQGIYIRNVDDSILQNNRIESVPIAFYIHKNNEDIMIMGNRIQGCTTPINLVDSTTVRPMIINNNWEGCTNDISYTSADSPRIQSNIDKDGNWWSVGDYVATSVSSTSISGGTIIGNYQGNQIEQQYLKSGTQYGTAYTERGSQIGGDHLTWDGLELDVDEDFLLNSSDDTTTGIITAAGFNTTGFVSSATISGGTIKFSVLSGSNYITAANMATLTDGSDADSLHTHGGIGTDLDVTSVSSTTISGGTIIGTWEGDSITSSYITDYIASSTAVSRFAGSSNIQSKFLHSGVTLNAVSAQRLWASDYISSQTGLYAHFVSANNAGQWKTKTGGIYYDDEVIIGHSNFDVGDYQLQVSGNSYFSGSVQFIGEISGVSDPTYASGVANKHYVDTISGNVVSQITSPAYISASAISGGTIIGGLHYPADYTIYKDGDSYYVNNENNKQISSCSHISGAHNIFNYTMNQIGSDGGNIEIKSGDYIISGDILIGNSDKVWLHGQGISTKIRAPTPHSGYQVDNWYAPASGAKIYISGSDYSHISDFMITGHIKVAFYNSNDILFENVRAEHIACVYWRLGVFNFSMWGDNAVCQNLTIRNCHISNSSEWGFNLDAQDDSNGTWRNVFVEGCSAIGCGGKADSWDEWAIGFNFAENNNITNCVVSDCIANNNYESGFHLENSRTKEGVEIVNCIARDNGNRKGSPDYGSGFFCGEGVTITNCTSINNNIFGIRAYNGGTIIGNTIMCESNSTNGIWGYIVDDNKELIIKNNRIYDSRENGIWVRSGQGCIVEGNHLYNVCTTDQSDLYGICLAYGNANKTNIISNNYLHGGDYCSIGIIAKGKSLITNNIVDYATSSGIYIYSGGTAIGNIVISAGVWASICVADDNCNVIGNKSFNSIGHGIRVIGGSRCNINGNSVYNATKDGIRLWDDSYYNTIESNIIINCGDDGIDDEGDYSIIVGNIVNGNVNSMEIDKTNTIVRNNIGYVTENSGWANISNAATIAHGCASKPTNISLVPSGSNPIMYSFTVDSSDITVYHSDAGSYDFSWRAEV